jgi:hypothetical protein
MGICWVIQGLHWLELSVRACDTFIILRSELPRSNYSPVSDRKDKQDVAPVDTSPMTIWRLTGVVSFLPRLSTLMDYRIELFAVDTKSFLVP